MQPRELFDLLIVYKSWKLGSETILEREREEETRRTTAPRGLENRLTMQLTIVHRGGSRSRWELDPFEDSSALQRRETIRKRLFLFSSSVTNPRAKPLLTKDWPPTLFQLSSFPFFVSLSLSLCESNRASRRAFFYYKWNIIYFLPSSFFTSSTPHVFASPACSTDTKGARALPVVFNYSGFDGSIFFFFFST